MVSHSPEKGFTCFTTEADSVAITRRAFGLTWTQSHTNGTSLYGFAFGCDDGDHQFALRHHNSFTDLAAENEHESSSLG
jgi:hypothetical protein